MANDNMRSGPRGSSNQSAYLRPVTIRLNTMASATVDTTNVNQMLLDCGVTRDHSEDDLVNGTIDYVVDASAATAGYGFPGMLDPTTWGGQWVIESLWVYAQVALAGNSGAFTVGVYARNVATQAVTAVDTNAFVTSRVLTLAQLPVLSVVHEIQLNGVGAGLEDNGGTGTGLISYTLGSQAAQYTDGAADVVGQDQFLVFNQDNAGGSAGDYVVTAALRPVGGKQYST